MDFKKFTYENAEEIEALADILEDFNEKFTKILKLAKTDDKYKKLVYGDDKENNIDIVAGMSISLDDYEETERDIYYGALCRVYEAMSYGKYTIPV